MRTASWVIRRKADGAVVCEVFALEGQSTVLAALNRDKYEAVPVLEHLQEFNRKAKEESERASS